MTGRYALAIAVLFLFDASLRPWRPFGKRGVRTAIYLAIPYLPMVAAPFLGRLEATVFSALFALFALYSYARMVGLTLYPRFFVPTVLASAAFFVVAPVRWYALFQAMPVFAVFLVVLAAAVRGRTDAFLQKMCLSWLGVLVYGYLWAHAALFVETDLGALPPGMLWLSLALFAAKLGDCAWVLAMKLRPGDDRLQPIATLLGGALGGLALSFLFPDAVPLERFVLFGAIVGGALGVGSRAFNLIVDDVVGAEVERPLKGTMMFGFAFALGLAYHYVRYLS